MAEDEAFALDILRREPGHVAAMHRLGQLYRADRRHAESLRWLTRALAIAPEDSVLWHERGLTRLAMGVPDAALIDFDEALRCAGGGFDAPAWHDRACAQMELGDPAAAEVDCLRSLAIDPGHAKAWTSLALARLSQGRLAEAWDAYEWRWAADGQPRPDVALGRPLWTGNEPLAGQRILLHAEQGLGDVLQFCRYVPMVAALGGQVLLHLPRPLARLLRGLEGAAAFVEDGAPMPPDVAFQCPLMSLPGAIGTSLATIPAAVPYLATPPATLAAWAGRLGPMPGPSVGIAWSGNPAHPRDAVRSLPLAPLLRAIPDGWGVIVLQKEISPDDATVLAGDGRVRRFDAEVGDFADTAALIRQTDLVLSADTAVAHLAGALGHPLWVLLPFAAEWRWMQARQDSPWYPTARLFRQPRRGDWGDVLRRVGARLNPV